MDPMTIDQHRGHSDLTLRRLEIFDPDALAESVTHGCLEHLQLRRGAFQGTLFARYLGGCVLNAGRHDRTLWARGEMPQRAVVVGAVLQARETGCISGSRFGPRDLICYPAGSELDYIQPAETHWIALQLPVDRLQDLLGVEPEDCALFATTRVLPASRPGVAALVQLLERLVAEGPLAPSRGLCEWETLLAERLRQLAMSSDRVTSSGRNASIADRMRLLRRFETMVRDQLVAPLRVPALCQALGVKQRTLEQAFKDQLGVSPYRYVQLLRLHAARRDLLAGAADRDGIAVVASRAGFAQPGRFSVHYREHFAETPSVTAAAAARRIRRSSGRPRSGGAQAVVGRQQEQRQRDGAPIGAQAGADGRESGVPAATAAARAPVSASIGAGGAQVSAPPSARGCP
jgi:AraC-like DNA-binding protein